MPREQGNISDYIVTRQHTVIQLILTGIESAADVHCSDSLSILMKKDSVNIAKYIARMLMSDFNVISVSKSC